jgi:hypothetical protein
MYLAERHRPVEVVSDHRQDRPFDVRVLERDRFGRANV